jgi:hypothetical protein
MFCAPKQTACAANGDPQSDGPQITAVSIGIDGAYKLGCWAPLTVSLRGGLDAVAGVVEVATQDPDAVGATVTAPFRLAARASAAVQLFIRIGQQSAPVTVRLIDDEGRVRKSRTFTPRRDPTSNSIPLGLPPTNKVVVTCGAKTDLAAELARAELVESTAEAVHTVLIKSAIELPTAWYGYESIDTVVLSGADPETYAVGDNLAPRVAALRRWVELGGCVVIFCGAGANEQIVEGGPLAPLVPGRFTGELVPLVDASPLESFVGAGKELAQGGPLRLLVPKVDSTQGRVLAEGPGALPLVIRARRGLGEVTFIAVDPETTPIDTWADRPNLLRESLQWPAPAPDAATAPSSGAANPDLSNQLRSALDQQFAGVSTTHFALVAGLVLAYVALIGPGDYFLLRRFKIMQWTWLTFPLAVLAASGVAYALAFRIKGTELRVNQVEVVDVDVAAGQVRGTVWTHIFNPRVQRFDLTFSRRFAGNPAGAPGHAAAVASPLVAWLGVPGAGLGAMQGRRSPISLFNDGYAFDADLSALRGMPVEQWSTKSLTARWTADVGPTIEAELHPLGDDELSGRLANHSGIRLEDCVLMRGGWAYKLPPLDTGATAVVDDSLPNATIKTMLTSAAAGDDPRVRTAEDGSVLFDGLSTDVARIAKLMMFYEAIGGAAYAGTPHRYQSFIDMSRLLAGDQAVLLARAPASSGSQWVRGATTRLDDKALAQPLAGDHDRRWVFYRFVLPLTKDDSTQQESPPLLGPSPIPLP